MFVCLDKNNKKGTKVLPFMNLSVTLKRCMCHLFPGKGGEARLGRQLVSVAITPPVCTKLNSEVLICVSRIKIPFRLLCSFVSFPEY